MFEYVKLYFISLGFSFIIAGLIVVFLKILKKDTVDIRNWLAKYINFQLAEWIVILFPWILAFILYFPVKDFFYTPSKEDVKKMVLKLYKNSPSFLIDVLQKEHKKIEDVVRDINVLYIKKLDDNTFKAYVNYKFLSLKCSAVLNINTIEPGKYFFKFDKVDCYPNF